MGTSPATVTRLVLLLSLMTIFILHSASCSCYFDRELQGQWDYTDKMIKTVHFGSQSVSFYDNQFKEPWINMQCYKKAGNIYLLRAPRIFSLNVDALLCVRIFRKLTNPIIYEVDVPLDKTFTYAAGYQI
ncbi:uncharacterized protein LOC141907669 isoform X2 [Tubulanus polymorphus]|uniref:uncharacterized protein LOC141907669 isoform X2 n=1 Tax=Tubulanus polymorphus TaxID=672921 RepID=UPI003DA3F7AB